MTKPVISVRFDSKASKAFDIMAQKGISGVAVVDEDGIIIHNTRWVLIIESLCATLLWLGRRLDERLKSTSQRSTSDLKALIMANNLDELSLDLTIEDFLVRLRCKNLNFEPYPSPHPAPCTLTSKHQVCIVRS